MYMPQRVSKFKCKRCGTNQDPSIRGQTRNKLIFETVDTYQSYQDREDEIGLFCDDCRIAIISFAKLQKGKS
jgi:hypothetical protein